MVNMFNVLSVCFLQDNIIFPGFYAPCSHSQVSNHLTLLGESLPPEPSAQSSHLSLRSGNRNRCSVPGILYNTNTLESFQALDKQSLMKAEAKKVLHACSSVHYKSKCTTYILKSEMPFHMEYMDLIDDYL